jgi:hypothetical protein
MPFNPTCALAVIHHESANNSHFLLGIRVVSTMRLEIPAKTGVQLAGTLLQVAYF